MYFVCRHNNNNIIGTVHCVIRLGLRSKYERKKEIISNRIEYYNVLSMQLYSYHKVLIIFDRKRLVVVK